MAEKNAKHGIFVTGTDTDVGKTWVGSRLIRACMKKNIDVMPRKPVESGWQENEHLTDAWQLANAAGKTNQLDEICSFRLKQPISPVRAARLENINLTLEKLVHHCHSNIHASQFLHVEGAGGFYSPLAENALNADLAEQLNLPVLLVAADKLGCINQILLTTEAIQRRGLKLLGIYLNQIDTPHTSSMNNQSDLSELLALPVVTQIEACVELIDFSFNS